MAGNTAGQGRMNTAPVSGTPGTRQ
jgi:hypothetical protein